MKKLLAVLIVSTFILSCTQQENKNLPTGEGVKDTLAVNEQLDVQYFGEKISEDAALTPEEFLTAFEGKDSLETKIKAEIKEVCSKKGCWMKIDLTDDKEMMIRFKDYGFFVPKDAAGKLTIFEGVARLDTISIEEQKHYLEDAGAPQSEIDAITDNKLAYSFEAKGVIIKNADN